MFKKVLRKFSEISWRIYGEISGNIWKEVSTYLLCFGNNFMNFQGKFLINYLLEF